MTALADLFLNSTGRIGRIRFLAGAACLIGVWVAVDIFLRTPGWLHALVAAALLAPPVLLAVVLGPPWSDLLLLLLALGMAWEWGRLWKRPS